LKIRFLGTHNAESKTSKLVSFLIDDVLAVEAGSLASQLTFAEQAKLGGILLSHGHYDHIKDVPALAFNSTAEGSKPPLKVFGTDETLQILESHLMDGMIYPEFAQSSSYLGRPMLALETVELWQPQRILGFTVTALPVTHTLEAIGFEITSEEGKSLFYTGDTGPGLSHLWQHTSPVVLVAETTVPTRMKDMARHAGHLCPETLREELREFKKIKNYLPRIILVHLCPEFEDEIRSEVKKVEMELGVSISIAAEGEVFDP
jgi:ribonuclease BN (tRNA processing enzyme)